MEFPDFRKKAFLRDIKNRKQDCGEIHRNPVFYLVLSGSAAELVNEGNETGIKRRVADSRWV